MNLLRPFILLRFLFLVLLVTTLFSCNKTNKYDLGEGLVQDNVGVTHLTNLPVNAVTITSSPQATGFAAYQMAGEYYDPYFGKHKAVLMAEFGLNKDVSTSFNGTETLDSIVWCLPYAGRYGDVSATNGSQTFKVYEITGGFSSANTYNSNESAFNFTTTSNLVGTIIAVPNLVDSVIINGVKKAPQLRLKLNTGTIGVKVLNALRNNSKSISGEVKGLMIYPDNPSQTAGQGAILSFDLLNENSKLMIYYRYPTTPFGQNLEYDGLYAYTNITQRASLFEHNYTNAAFAPQLNGAATDTNNIFIQSMMGTQAKIDFPIIKSLKDSGRLVINKAEVTFKIDESISELSKYYPNSRMYLLPVDSDGIALDIKDEFDIIVPYGGIYDAVNNQYTFNIGQYFQDVINGKITNYGMVLIAGSPKINAERTILKTKENIIFNLTYTKF